MSPHQVFSELLTIGDLAEAAGLKIHQVEYLIRRDVVKPSGRVGRYRLFDKDAVKAIRHHINQRGIRLSRMGGRGNA